MMKKKKKEKKMMRRRKEKKKVQFQMHEFCFWYYLSHSIYKCDCNLIIFGSHNMQSINVAKVWLNLLVLALR